MPELPEVETVVRGLRGPLTGRTITAMRYDWGRTFETPDAPQFADRIRGQRIRGVGRRGKYVLIALKPDTLIVHLRMTGSFGFAPVSHERAVLELDDGSRLAYRDVRRFGTWLALEGADLENLALGDLVAQDGVVVILGRRLRRGRWRR